MGVQIRTNALNKIKLRYLYKTKTKTKTNNNNNNNNNSNSNKSDISIESTISTEQQQQHLQLQKQQQKQHDKLQRQIQKQKEQLKKQNLFNVKFNEKVFVSWTYSQEEYERAVKEVSEPKLSGKVLLDIHEDLDNYKESEMIVHELSQPNTLFYKNSKKREQYELEKKNFFNRQHKEQVRYQKHLMNVANAKLTNQLHNTKKQDVLIRIPFEPVFVKEQI
eukprot:Pgem_evm1s560